MLVLITCLFNWLLDNEIVVAVLIAILGWIITHILNIKAQNNLFVHNIINDARSIVVIPLRDYQKWLGEVHITISFLSSMIELMRKNPENPYLNKIDWKKVRNDLRNLYRDESLVWAYRLEEHEILFPRTTNLRKELLSMNIHIKNALNQLLFDLCSSDLDERVAAVDTIMNNHYEFIIDQMCLIEDLLIYLQNYCYSKLTGNKVPERKPLDEGRPSIVKGECGNLEIKRGKTGSAVKD